MKNGEMISNCLDQMSLSRKIAFFRDVCNRLSGLLENLSNIELVLYRDVHYSFCNLLAVRDGATLYTDFIERRIIDLSDLPALKRSMNICPFRSLDSDTAEEYED